MNTGRLSYGGKVGVWISHKRKKRAVQHRNRKNPSSSSSALLSQYSHHSMMFRRAASRLSYNGGSKDPLVGWDEVKCRPVYYNNSSQQTERNDDKHQEMDEHTNDNDKEQLDVLSWEKSRVKKSYGSQITNRHRKGRLSSLANSVLENVASPIATSFPGTKKCSSGSSSSSTVLNADDDADGSNSEDNLNNFSMLAMYEHDISSDDDCKTSSNDENDLQFTSELQFEILNESTNHHGRNSTRGKRKICIQAQKEQVKSSSKHSKKVKSNDEDENQQTTIKTLRQPTHSSSLEEAKAFFDQLDREELKIVSSEE